MNVKLKLLIISLNLSLGFNGQISALAQTSQSLTAQEFLNSNNTTQLIYLNSFSKSREDLINACVQDFTEEELREYFVQWIRQHPQNLNRTAHLAFTLSLGDRCESQSNSLE